MTGCVKLIKPAERAKVSESNIWLDKNRNPNDVYKELFLDAYLWSLPMKQFRI